MRMCTSWLCPFKYPKFKEVKWQYANMTAGDCLFLPYSEYAAITTTSIPLAGYIFLQSRLRQVDQSKNNVLDLPVYKLTFCSQESGPKNYP